MCCFSFPSPSHAKYRQTYKAPYLVFRSIKEQSSERAKLPPYHLSLWLLGPQSTVSVGNASDAFFVWAVAVLYLIFKKPKAIPLQLGFAVAGRKDELCFLIVKDTSPELPGLDLVLIEKTS